MKNLPKVVVRKITWRPIKPISDTEGGDSGGGAPTDHSHTNKSVLDSLNFDNNGRLTRNGILVNAPLIEEQW